MLVLTCLSSEEGRDIFIDCAPIDIILRNCILVRWKIGVTSENVANITLADARSSCL